MGGLRVGTQGLCGIDGPDIRSDSEISYTATQPATPNLNREAETHMALPNESPNDAKRRRGTSFIFTDAGCHDTLTSNPVSQENVEEITISCTLNAGRPLSIHTAVVRPGSYTKSRQTFTVLGPWGIGLGL